MSVAAPQLRPANVTVTLSPLASRWTPDRIYAAEFFPEDASVKLELHPMPDNVRSSSTRYPSEQQSRSPRGSHLLRCVTNEEAGVEKHSLILEDPRGGAAKTIWTTELPFEVMWSGEGDAVAISQDFGNGRVDVFVHFLVYERTYALPDVFPKQLEDILSPAQLRSQWDFRALGWVPHQGLVVRGVGRDEQEPYQDYGHEFVVHFMKGAGPSYPASLLRAYRRDRAENNLVR